MRAWRGRSSPHCLKVNSRCLQRSHCSRGLVVTKVPVNPSGLVEKSHFLAALSEESILFTAAGWAAGEWERNAPTDGSAHAPIWDIWRQKEAGTLTVRCPKLNSLLPDGCCSPGTQTRSFPVLLLDVSCILASISPSFLVLTRGLHVYRGALFSVDGSPC